MQTPSEGVSLPGVPRVASTPAVRHPAVRSASARPSSLAAFVLVVAIAVLRLVLARNELECLVVLQAKSTQHVHVEPACARGKLQGAPREHGAGPGARCASARACREAAPLSSAVSTTAGESPLCIKKFSRIVPRSFRCHDRPSTGFSDRNAVRYSDSATERCDAMRGGKATLSSDTSCPADAGSLVARG